MSAGRDERSFERALAELTKELRDREPPEVDFDRLEKSLFAKIDAEPVPVVKPTKPVPWGPIALAALAAAAAFVLGTRPRSEGILPTPITHETRRAASPRHVVVGEAQSFEKAGLAKWTFDAGSAADVTEEEARVTVALASGAVNVDVVPQDVPERFVVVVDHVRVAVHGTTFRVAKKGTDVDVDVSHGIVTVTSIEGKNAWKLPAPIGGTFAADGHDGALREIRPFGSGSVALAPLDITAPVPPVVRSAPPRDAKSDVPPGPPPSAVVAETAPPLDAMTLMARATSIASDCFAARAHIPTDVTLTVSTKMMLAVDANGVVSASFQPELAPAVEACIRDSLTNVRAAAGFYEVPLSLAGRR